MSQHVKGSPKTGGPGNASGAGAAAERGDHRPTSEALHESEAKYAALMERARDGVFIIQDGLCKFANQATADICGYSMEEMMDKPYTALVRDESRQEAAEEYSARVAGDTGVEPVELEVLRKDGTTRHVEISGAVIQHQGEPALMGIMRDITERKQAAEALRESERRYRLLSENASDIIWVIDLRTGQLKYVNPAVTLLRGYSVEEAMAQTLEQSLTPSSLEAARKAVENALVMQARDDERRFKPLTIELEMTCRDGSTIWTESRLTSHRSPDGETDEVVGVARDITERRKAEEERKRLNEELAQRNRELEQLLYFTSHDLRSPLVNIQGFSREMEYSIEELRSALGDGSLRAEVQEKVTPVLEADMPESLGYIRTSISKMDVLLSALLRLSRAGRSAPEMERTDMGLLLADIHKGAEFRLRDQDVKLDIGELPPCRGDAAQLSQVFSNLLDNALKYLDTGRPGSIRIIGWTENGRSVYCVEDNGIGISQEHQTEVFQMFHQVDRKAGGDGMGLAIVKKIVGRHGGRVWVESEPGVGSRFYVSLPGVNEG